MRKLVNDPRLMTKVCDLYYNQNMSRQDIMEELKLSRPTIARLLDAARTEGIVQITIPNLELIQYWELERELEKQYGLKEVLVVESFAEDGLQKQALGRASARYLQSVLSDESKVGISMGSTLYAMTEHLVPKQMSGVTVVPLVGGMGQLRMELHANSLAERMAKAYGGTFLPLHAPARVSNATIRRELMKEESFAPAFQCMNELDIALIGIGYPNESSALKATGYYKEDEIEMLLEKEVAGELCMQFYDVHGNTAPYKKETNVIGVDVKKLRKIPICVGVAGGLEKLSAIRGAIAGKYINTLITDADCAMKLIQSDR